MIQDRVYNCQLVYIIKHKYMHVVNKKWPLALMGAMLMLFSAAELMAQTIVHPGIASATRFAVIIDEDTYSHTREAVLAYKNMLETKEKLGTYIVYANWKKPEEIQAVLQKLSAARPVLEGALLAGHIPVAMIRNAQHMTTAFKMDEQKYSLDQSSVASDRFYDDFDLRFRLLKQDEKRPLWFYYELTEESPQTINSDIYTARVLSHGAGETAYKEINSFFLKAVAARASEGPLDQLLAFTGSGYNSESLSAWADEQLMLREIFPGAFKQVSNNRILNFRMDTAIKYRLLGELQRPGTDLAYLSEHGDIGRQYINDRGSILTKELADVSVAAKMVIFNACYNGSFHHPGNIAGAYIFNQGQTVVTQGNTVNALQDKYALQLAGLLHEGVRVGIWNSQINSLEAHLLGDPTWRFTNTTNLSVNSELISGWKNESFWLKRLKHSSQAQRSLALLRLFRLNYKEAPKLAAAIYDTAGSVSDRMQCFSLLASTDGPLFTDILIKAMRDPHEYIRRKAAEWTARTGDDKLVAPLVQLLLARPNDERVVWTGTRSLAVMNIELAKAEIQKQTKDIAYILHKDSAVTNWMKQLDEEEQRATAALTGILDKTAPDAKRVQAVRLLRNSNYHRFVPQLIVIASDNTQPPAVRQQLIEAMGWFSNSYQKPLLLKAFNAVISDSAAPELVRKEARQSVGRLTQWQLL